MPERPMIILSLVERGWRAARECSLDVQRHGIEIVHLIKGRLDCTLLALVAPYPQIRLISVGRGLFWPAAWLRLVWYALSGRLHVVLVDNEKSLRRLRPWMRLTSAQVLMVLQGHEGYELWADPQQRVQAAWDETLGAPCGLP